MMGQNSIEIRSMTLQKRFESDSEDALGALLRGKQVIIVGDEKQLPPTSFFERKTADDDEDDEDDAGVDGESVLALAARAFAPQRLLMWHYRSQHDSLINFSNAEFYDSKLVVFPSLIPSLRSRHGIAEYAAAAQHFREPPHQGQ
ncbi:hypothetical protein [Acidiphilium acidophilum]|uniref:hypothetical protein n=1 Tax=Acidiphilium acidophilum TaxID=76588 RepID=UPI002E8E6CDA|nr:hypothetical protein [Acidiphilium acidophilum]